MNTVTDLILIGALAAAWLAAGLLADALPVARTARELRRRARVLSILVGAGGAVFVAVALVTGALPGVSSAPTAALIAAVPALIVLTVTWRRLKQIRHGAGAFATAPMAPVPPALRAAAAHPLVATPLQITGLAALAGVPIAAGIVGMPTGEAVGIVLTVTGLVVTVLGIRHAIRHNRLSFSVLAPIGRRRLRALPSAQHADETYTALPAEPAEPVTTAAAPAAAIPAAIPAPVSAAKQAA